VLNIRRHWPAGRADRPANGPGIISMQERPGAALR
jgi:hypothetical protein